MTTTDYLDWMGSYDEAKKTALKYGVVLESYTRDGPNGYSLVQFVGDDEFIEMLETDYEEGLI